MKKIMLCGFALLALISAPAMAADLPVRKAPPPPPPPVYIWSGFYLGIHGGYGKADADTRFNTVGDFNRVVGDGFSHDFDGGLFGGHFGYNWQWAGNWLFGIELAGTWSDVSKSVASPFFPLDDTFTAEINWLFTFTPRLGVTSGNWLFYVKGGLAVADFTARVATTIGPGFVIEKSDTRSGWTVGGGIEVMTGSAFPFGSGGNWVFGIEGNYYDFGSVNVVSRAPALFRTDHDHDVTMWSVLGRLTWKFGGPLVAPRY